MFKRIAFLCFAVVMVTPVLLLSGCERTNHVLTDDCFRVTVSSYELSIYQGEWVWVTAIVTNQSGRTIPIRHWEHFEHTPVEGSIANYVSVMQNAGPTLKRLRNNESFSASHEIFVYPDAESGIHEMRIGFMIVINAGRENSQRKMFWSEPVTVTIKEK